MKGKRSLALLLGMVLLCALLSGCAEKLTPAERYGHLRDRYIIYDSFIYVVEGGEEPSQEFVQAREALIMARYDEAYTGFESLAGAADGDLERARCLNGMAVTQAIQSRYAACNELFEQALGIYEGLGEESSVEMALCMQNKAIMLYDQTLFDDAENMMEHAFQNGEKLPHEHPDRAVIELTYGQVIALQNLTEGLQQTYNAYNKMEAVFGENSLMALTCKSGEHVVYRGHISSGAYDWNMEKAAAFYPVQLEAVKAEYGEGHPLVGMAYLNMGQMYIKQDQYVLSILKNMDLAESILLPIYGENHIKVFYINATRANYYTKLKQYDMSLECHVKMIEQLAGMQMYGRQDAYYAYCLGDIANNYIYLDEPEQAVKYYLRHCYILDTYWDDPIAARTKQRIEAIYNEYNLSDQPFEEWYDEQMAYHAAHEDEPMIVEGYEYLYE